MEWLLLALLTAATAASVDHLPVNLSAAFTNVPDEIFGLNFEFTRHDIWEGLSAQLIANRLFAIQPAHTSWPYPSGGWGSFPPRWKPVGTPQVAPNERYAGEGSNAVVCAGKGVLCGVEQSQYGDGFDAGMSFGSAIVLTSGNSYSFAVALKGAPAAAVMVTIGCKDGVIAFQEVFHVASKWEEFMRNFSSPISTDNATLRISNVAPQYEPYALGALSLTPSITFHGMRTDVVQSLQSLGFHGLLRYPGGCFAPFYDWKADLAPSLRRSPMFTPPNYCAAVRGGVDAYSDGLMENGINTDEYIALVHALDAIPAITVSLQFGTEEEVTRAAAWVEYCNGDPHTTAGGAERARRGHLEPYNVQHWYLGNEMNQQARFPNYPNNTSSVGPPSPQEYASFLRPLMDAMTKANGGNPLLFFVVEGGEEWDGAWAKAVGPDVYATSFHHGYAPDPPSIADYTTTVKIPTTSFIPSAGALRERLATLGVGHVRISADEWGLGPPWTVQHFGVSHALYAASMLAGTLGTPGMVSFTNYFEPVNEGALTVHKRNTSLTPVGVVLQVYSVHSGACLVPLAQPFDADVLAVATVDTDQALVVTLANRNATASHALVLTISGGQCTGSVVEVVSYIPDVVGPTGVFQRHDSTLHMSAQTVATDVEPFTVQQLRIPCDREIR